MLPALIEQHPLLVLVVDDEHLIRWSIAESLTAAGHQVVEAATACDAVARATQDTPDVIVLDHCLPDCQDFSVLTTLRRLAPDAGIVVISCKCDGPDFPAEAQQHGACEALSKPFDLDRLCRAVETAARVRLLRQAAASMPPVRRRAPFDVNLQEVHI